MRLSYVRALQVGWSVTWRLLLANVVLVLLIVAFTTVLTPALERSGSFALNVFYGVMEWLLAWPFVARVALAPQVLSPDLYPPSAFNPKRQRSPVRYGPAVLFGVVVDAVSALPLLALAWALHSLASAPLLIVLFLLIRLFVVLPLGAQLLSRRLEAAVAA